MAVKSVTSSTYVPTAQTSQTAQSTQNKKANNAQYVNEYGFHNSSPTPTNTNSNVTYERPPLVYNPSNTAVKTNNATNVSQPNAYSVNSNANGKIGYTNSQDVDAAAQQEQEDIAAAVAPNTVTSTTASNTIKYLDDYNQDKIQKIKDMYAGNIAAQNAQQQTAYDNNLAALKAAYDNNLGTLKTSYDNSTGALKTAYDTNLNSLQTAYDNNIGSLKTAYDQNLGNLKTAYEKNQGSLKTAYDANTGTLKTAYDKNVGSLNNAYEQNLSDAEAYKAGISPKYQEAMNNLAAQNEIERRNVNMQGAANGLNTGAGSQLALGQSAAYQRNQGTLSKSEVEALNEAEKMINDLNNTYWNNYNILETEYNNNLANLDKQYANDLNNLGQEYNNNQSTYSTTYNNELNKLKTELANNQNTYSTTYQNDLAKLAQEYANNQNNYATNYQNSLASIEKEYQNKIAEAAANNNYQLAAALLDEYGAQYDRITHEAETLAQFGDFSLYANVYGIEAAQQMEKAWSLQNPDLAYNLGKITADDYFNMTGRYPSNYSGGGFGSGLTVGTWQPYYGGVIKKGYKGGGGKYKGYTGPAGYYTTDGNFYVPDTGKFYGSSSGTSIDPADQAYADNLAKYNGWTGA